MSQRQRARQYLDAGLDLQRRGQAVQALDAYRKAMTADPALHEASHRYGVALCEIGQAEAGVGVLRRTLQHAPQDAQLHASLARVLRDADLALALEHAQRAAALAPADAALAVEHARLLQAAGRDDDAVAAFETARALAPGRSDVLRSLAELHYRNDRLDAAETAYKAALQLRPALAQSLRLGHARPGPAPAAGRRLRLDELRRCSLPDDAAVEAAAAARDLHVWDDFVADFAAYRHAALATRFEAQQYRGQNFPGLQSAGCDCPETMQRIADLLDRTVKFISPDNGAFRLSFAGAKARGDIHADDQPGQNEAYAGVLYLNLPEHCRGGTVFWRHDETGWERRPGIDELRAAGYADAKAFHRRWLPRDEPVAFEALTQRRAGWTPVFEVPMVPNRLIVYRGDWFHSIGEVFGSTPEDGRLAQLFFFESA